MDSVNKTLKTIRSFYKLDNATTLNYTAYAIFALSVLYIFYRSQIATIGLSIGVALILYAVTGGNLPVSLIAGALVGLTHLHYSRHIEKFANEEEGEDEEMNTEEPFEEEEIDEGFEGDEGDEGEVDEEENIEEGFANKPKKAKAKKAKKQAPPPDNGERAEFLELGKKYKMPSEGDDKDFHLDAGTTFMNAYKSLKPDQIAAMTKDTQDLMSTQKQLMSTLQTLKPLIKDGKEMMDMFQGYFGASTN
jgi:hypothetical protein